MMFTKTHKYDPCSMRVGFRVYQGGGVDLDLWLNSDHYDFSFDDVLSWPLYELIRAVISLKIGEGDASFTVDTQPGQHSWNIRRLMLRPKLLKIVITCYDAPDSDLFSPQVLKIYVDRHNFIDSFVAAFDELAAKMKGPEDADKKCQFPWEQWHELRGLCGTNCE